MAWDREVPGRGRRSRPGCTASRPTRAATNVRSAAGASRPSRSRTIWSPPTRAPICSPPRWPSRPRRSSGSRSHSTSCPPKLRSVVVLKDVYDLHARGHRRRARYHGRRREGAACTGAVASCATCSTTKEPRLMLCDEVTALLPGLVDGDIDVDRDAADVISRPASVARPSCSLPPAARTLACCAAATPNRHPACSVRPSPCSPTPPKKARAGRCSRAGAWRAWCDRWNGGCRRGHRRPADRPFPQTVHAAGPARPGERCDGAPGSRGLISCIGPHPVARRAVAGLAEHRSPKPAVGGSIPSCPAQLPRRSIPKWISPRKPIPDEAVVMNRQVKRQMAKQGADRSRVRPISDASRSTRRPSGPRRVRICARSRVSSSGLRAALCGS